ncbi:MAG: helix-turn-helix domain-containing protein [Bacteroidota bacterium]
MKPEAHLINLIFEKIQPTEALSSIVKEYWHVENDESYDIVRQKIIPDGYTEIIMHYKDPYRINIEGIWKTQSKFLLAGQITDHFFIENTGCSGMYGIKFQPTGLNTLFNLWMDHHINKVNELQSVLGKKADIFIEGGYKMQDFQDLTDNIERYLINILSGSRPNQKIEEAVSYVLAHAGLVKVSELTKLVGLSERQLERGFKRCIGLTPKRYIRIIRFARIFDRVKNNGNKWTEIALDSGFFDQSHFIKDFKEFTGEDPTEYLFEQKNMANFFLRRK